MCILHLRKIYLNLKTMGFDKEICLRFQPWLYHHPASKVSNLEPKRPRSSQQLRLKDWAFGRGLTLRKNMNVYSIYVFMLYSIYVCIMFFHDIYTYLHDMNISQ